MPNKMKIRVHESEETLLDSFESLATICSLVGGELSNKSSYSLLRSVRDIQNGSEAPLDKPEDVKYVVEKKKNNLVAAFDKFLGKLDAYL